MRRRRGVRSRRSNPCSAQGEVEGGFSSPRTAAALCWHEGRRSLAGYARLLSSCGALRPHGGVSRVSTPQCLHHVPRPDGMAAHGGRTRGAHQSRPAPAAILVRPGRGGGRHVEPSPAPPALSLSLRAWCVWSLPVCSVDPWWTPAPPGSTPRRGPRGTRWRRPSRVSLPWFRVRPATAGPWSQPGLAEGALGGAARHAWPGAGGREEELVSHRGAHAWRASGPPPPLLLLLA